MEIIQNPHFNGVLLNFLAKMAFLIFVHAWNRPLGSVWVYLNADQISFNVHAHNLEGYFGYEDIWTSYSLRQCFPQVEIFHRCIHLIENFLCVFKFRRVGNLYHLYCWVTVLDYLKGVLDCLIGVLDCWIWVLDCWIGDQDCWDTLLVVHVQWQMKCANHTLERCSLRVCVCVGT